MIPIGCSGWNYASWRASFYPEALAPSRWLEHYASIFDTVEVNATFYRLARREAVQRWTRQTPEGFCFAVKSSRYLTHVKRLTDLDRGVQRLYEPLEPLARAGRLGPVLWQLPPSFHRDDERLALALARLPAGRHAFELRLPSWFCDDVYELLRRPAARSRSATGRRSSSRRTRSLRTSPTCASTTAAVAGAATTPSPSFASGRAGSRAWGRSIDVYAYFNNDWEVFAPRNAKALRRMVAAQTADAEAPT